LFYAQSFIACKNKSDRLNLRFGGNKI